MFSLILFSFLIQLFFHIKLSSSPLSSFLRFFFYTQNIFLPPNTLRTHPPSIQVLLTYGIFLLAYPRLVSQWYSEAVIRYVCRTLYLQLCFVDTATAVISQFYFSLQNRYQTLSRLNRRIVWDHIRRIRRSGERDKCMIVKVPYRSCLGTDP